MTIRATVRTGRLVVDEPTDMPDGAEVELLPAADRLIDAADVLKALRSR